MQNNEKYAFCIECGDKKPYVLRSAEEKITIRGKTFSYLEYTAFCSECGTEIYVPEINDMNAQARENGFAEV